jgi:asparagine synthase (glutamine-hydrolysing)
MCGICGKFNFDTSNHIEPALVNAMMDTITHRGPDDQGTYVKGAVGLGFRRLAIIDLKNGHQPLSNEDGTVWIVFNGEIYNYRELREELVSKGHIFKTHTDTEVIVHLYEELGPECLQRLRGMFAFAVWDENNQSLFLARDRVGIKPLYYSLTADRILFASEIKAILADFQVQRNVDPEVIHRFLTFMYLPGEETLLKGIRKLAPGHYLLAKDGTAEIRQYWDLQFTKSKTNDNLKHTEEELTELLARSVELHMIADVPVGVLLSGGVDSTAVLSFAVERTSKAISSFTVGFADSNIADERPYAKLAADTFGTQHYDMTISARDFAEFLPGYVWHMEEPVCEPPAVAMYYVSKLARDYVTVLLSGEGGDEGFAGYSNYRNVLWLERLKSFMPGLNGVASSGLSGLNFFVRSPRIEKYVPLIRARFPEYYYSRTSNPYMNFGNGLGQLCSADFLECFDREHAIQPLQALFARVKNEAILDQMLYLDTKTWLPDDLLTKADRMTMANSLELRVPLLDHLLLEFAAALPTGYKVNGFSLKYILMRALGKRVPTPILRRKKAGFPVPYERWMRSELKCWISDLLLDRKTIGRGYFQRPTVEKLVCENMRTGAHSKQVFSMAVLELWHRQFLDADLGTVHLDRSSSLQNVAVEC